MAFISSELAARIPGHNEFDNETISLGERTVELQGTPQQSFTSELRIQTENIASLFDEPFSAPFGEVHVETAPSFTDADGAQVSFDYTSVSSVVFFSRFHRSLTSFIELDISPLMLLISTLNLSRKGKRRKRMDPLTCRKKFRRNTRNMAHWLLDLTITLRSRENVQ